MGLLGKVGSLGHVCSTSSLPPCLLMQRATSGHPMPTRCSKVHSGFIPNSCKTVHSSFLGFTTACVGRQDLGKAGSSTRAQWLHAPVGDNPERWALPHQRCQWGIQAPNRPVSSSLPTLFICYCCCWYHCCLLEENLTSQPQPYPQAIQAFSCPYANIIINSSSSSTYHKPSGSAAI